MFALVQVPKHGYTIFASRSSERPVRGDGNSVDVTSVTVVVGLKFELREFPNLMSWVSKLTIREIVPSWKALSRALWNHDIVEDIYVVAQMSCTENV